MIEFVTAKKEALQTQGIDEVVEPGQPLGHAVVVGVFSSYCGLLPCTPS
jgi:hypothetical protein